MSGFWRVDDFCAPVDNSSITLYDFFKKFFSSLISN